MLQRFAASLAAHSRTFASRPLANNTTALMAACCGPRPAAAARSALLRTPRAAPPLLTTAVRSILTVDVHQPGNRMGSGPLSSPVSLAEVARAEEIALASFNRMVFQEVERGCLRPGARRNKRWARKQKRVLRANRMASKWRAHKRKLTRLMNWIQYRQRRSLAR